MKEIVKDVIIGMSATDIVYVGYRQGCGWSYAGYLKKMPGTFLDKKVVEVYRNLRGIAIIVDGCSMTTQNKFFDEYECCPEDFKTRPPLTNADEPYMALYIAIVKQAAEDYRNYIKNGHHLKDKMTKEDIESSELILNTEIGRYVTRLIDVEEKIKKTSEYKKIPKNDKDKKLKMILDAFKDNRELRAKELDKSRYATIKGKSVCPTSDDKKKSKPKYNKTIKEVKDYLDWLV